MLKITSYSACCTRQNTSFYPTSDQKKNQFVIFHHMIHPCWTLSAAGSFPLHLLSLFPPPPHIKRWVALSPSCRYQPRQVTSRHISIFIVGRADFKVSSQLLTETGEAPPGSRHRLQSGRRSPGDEISI